MRVGRSGIQICSAVPGSINNSILWDRKCPKKFCLKDYEVLKYFFQYLQRKIMWETAKKTFNQTEWVYDCSWWQRALKDFSQRVFANLRDSSQCGKPVKPSGSVCQSQRPRKKSSHPTLLRKYCQVIKQIQPPYRRKYWRFCKICNQVDHFCNIWGKYVIFGANNDSRRSNQNSQPLLCDKYPLGNLFLKLFLFFPLVPFCQTHFFFYYFPGVEGFHGELSWETRLPMRIELPPPSYNNQMDLRAETSDNWKRNLNFL